MRRSAFGGGITYPRLTRYSYANLKDRITARNGLMQMRAVDSCKTYRAGRLHDRTFRFMQCELSRAGARGHSRKLHTYHSIMLTLGINGIIKHNYQCANFGRSATFSFDRVRVNARGPEVQLRWSEFSRNSSLSTWVRTPVTGIITQ